MIRRLITTGSKMVRRTINLPESVDSLIRERAREGESFSATTTRLVEAGAREESSKPLRPRFVASGTGPTDLGLRAEEYLRELAVQE